MIDIENYISQLIKSLKGQFGSRLLYVGLQGSYLRGEDTEQRDIDIMVIIEELSVSDLQHYRTIIQSLGHFEKSCGFICSKADLLNWNPLEIQHLLNGTKDYYGTLIDFTPPLICSANPIYVVGRIHTWMRPSFYKFMV
ncbi:MAG: nucleotidyltransferase domain-containing protein [Oscillospiraceae bacterium]|nr:nucleotidyltransferase domain-containing protein [Oscillospiraceae bacterium]